VRGGEIAEHNVFVWDDAARAFVAAELVIE
jgi:hypothetical protein